MIKCNCQSIRHRLKLSLKKKVWNGKILLLVQIGMMGLNYSLFIFSFNYPKNTNKFKSARLFRTLCDWTRTLMNLPG